MNVAPYLIKCLNTWAKVRFVLLFSLYQAFAQDCLPCPLPLILLQTAELIYPSFLLRVADWSPSWFKRGFCTVPLSVRKQCSYGFLFSLFLNKTSKLVSFCNNLLLEYISCNLSSPQCKHERHDNIIPLATSSCVRPSVSHEFRTHF